MNVEESEYVFAENTFSAEIKSNPKDRIQIEVGDAKQPDFKPQYKFMRWDNEVNFSIRAAEHPEATVETDGKIIKYRTPEYEVHQYTKPEVSDDGGFEFEWVLLTPPASNVLTATIQSKGLDFFYQPELTDEEKKKCEDNVFCTILGCRPANVIGSYAVYHQTKGKLNDETGMEYKSGKAFHIYRPQATDAKGNQVWCDLNINDGLMTVTVPQDFLDNGVYPITVDPTFGNTVTGGSRQCVGSDEMEIIKFTSPAGGGTITSMSFASDTICGGNFVAGQAIYSDLVGVPNSLLAQDSGDVTVNSATTQFWTNNISYAFAGTTPYWLTVFLDTPNGQYYYDAGAATMYFAAGTFESYPNPWTDVSHNLNRNVSIFATYTASGDTPVATPVPLLTLLGVG